MKCAFISQALLLTTMAFVSSFLLSLSVVGSLERGEKAVKEMLLSSITCPATCKDKDGKHCCNK